MTTLSSAASQASALFDRSDKLTAKKVVERLLPDATTRGLVLRLMEDVIRKASGTAPETWGITLHPDEVKLSVGGWYAVVHVHPGIVSVYSDPVPDDEALKRENQLRSQPDVARYFLKHDQIAEWLPIARLGVLSYVERVLALNYRIHPGMRKAHSPGVLRYAEEALDLQVTLPDPAYPPPAPLVPTRPAHYWRVGTREGAERINRWQAMQEGGFASIGWGQLGDLRQRLGGLNPAAGVLNIADFVRSVNLAMNPAVATRYGKQWYAFSHDMRAGDIVVAMDGEKIVGIGEASGDYVFDPEDELQPHHVPVVWGNILSQVWKNHPGYLTTVHDFTDNANAVSYIDQLLNSEPMPITTPDPNAPLNQILYGPPGTGKTYNTVIKAVQILSDISIREMSDAHPHWDTLRSEDRIEFVTFHQSYGYEDFLEGLRPVVDDEDDETGLRYSIVDGALKRIALRALGAMLEPIPDTPTTPARIPFDVLWAKFIDEIEQNPDKEYDGLSSSSKWLMRQSKHGAVQANNVKKNAAYWYSAPYSKMETVFNTLRDTTEPVNTTHISAIFAESLQQNVAAMVFRELKRLERESDWNVELVPTDITPHAERARAYLKNGEKSGYRLNTVNPPRYVLVMDEINRGNISKIFGELITLIEDDKRVGASVSLTATLPLSGEKFALPPNLYLLGTMNTADKSIALVDIALRRRFDFVELMPDFDTCTGLTPLMRKVLGELNHRITLYKDRDHQIGHAFFKNVSTPEGFNAVWEGKLLPLLQEYFYNDWDALRAVIGETGNSGILIRALPALPNMPRTRNKWQWYTDAGATINPLQALGDNYGFGTPQGIISSTPSTEDTVDGATGSTAQ